MKIKSWCCSLDTAVGVMGGGMAALYLVVGVVAVTHGPRFDRAKTNEAKALHAASDRHCEVHAWMASRELLMRYGRRREGCSS